MMVDGAELEIVLGGRGQLLSTVFEMFWEGFN
jgi:hypothetical protein